MKNVELLTIRESDIMESEKYDEEKWKKIMDTTQMNYANMLKRLTRKSKVSNMVLIYYSIFLIMISLTCKYFPYSFNCNLAEYFNIVLSVIILAYSLINNNANYDIRINNIEESLNKIKNIKRELSDDKLEKSIGEYKEITDKTERREDIDFYNTVSQLNKKYQRAKKVGGLSEEDRKKIEDGEKAVSNYLSEIDKLHEILKIAFEYSWNVVLILIPIFVFGACIVIKK